VSSAPSPVDELVEINMSKPLKEMSGHIDFINDDYKQIYKSNLVENNINGKVLACCDIDELKSELQMTFGDWQVFKAWILQQRKLTSEKRISSKLTASAYGDNFDVLKKQKEEMVAVRNSPGTPVNQVVGEAVVARSGRKVEFFITPVAEEEGAMVARTVTNTPDLNNNNVEASGGVSKLGKKIYDGIFNKGKSGKSELAKRTSECESLVYFLLIVK